MTKRNEPLGVCDNTKTPHVKMGRSYCVNWRPVEASAPPIHEAMQIANGFGPEASAAPPACPACDSPNPVEPHNHSTLSLMEWVQERFENCVRLSGMCAPEHREGWLEDASYFRHILMELSSFAAKKLDAAPDAELRPETFTFIRAELEKKLLERYDTGFAAGKTAPDAELRELREMPDSQIDTSDLPEVRDWSKAERGKFYHGDAELRELRARLDEHRYCEECFNADLNIHPSYANTETACSRSAALRMQIAAREKELEGRK